MCKLKRYHSPLEAMNYVREKLALDKRQLSRFEERDVIDGVMMEFRRPRHNGNASWWVDIESVSEKTLDTNVYPSWWQMGPARPL